MSKYFKIKIYPKRALTLLEVLLVVSMTSLISIAVFRSLASGIEIWKKTLSLSKEEDIAIFFDKITADLRNTFNFNKSEFNFLGDIRSVSFPTIVHTLKDKRLNNSFEDQYHDQLGKVEYYFDTSKKKLFRRQANYSQTLYKIYGNSYPLINSIKNVEFFFLYNNEEGEFFSEKVLDKMPLGIDIRVRLNDFGEERIISKYINVPLNM